jgi:hypothetical protein
VQLVPKNNVATKHDASNDNGEPIVAADVAPFGDWTRHQAQRELAQALAYDAQERIAAADPRLARLMRIELANQLDDDAVSDDRTVVAVDLVRLAAEEGIGAEELIADLARVDRAFRQLDTERVRELLASYDEKPGRGGRAGGLHSAVGITALLAGSVGALDIAHKDPEAAYNQLRKRLARASKEHRDKLVP